MKIINLIAGPGAGKSTTAAGLFNKMKLAGYQCELITEYAKELTYEKRFDTLSNQVYVFAKQWQKIERLRDQVEYVITDSPILLSSIYAPKGYPTSFHQMVMDFWNMDENNLIYIQRAKEYQKYGRSQTEDEAKQVDHEIKSFLDNSTIPFTIVHGTPHAPEDIMTHFNLDKLY